MKKSVYIFLVVLFASFHIFAQVSGDYRTGQAAVTWSTAAHWETYNGVTWVAASSKPGSTNNVYIQNGHTVTLTGNEACNDLHLNKDNTQNRLALGTNTLEINGKIRAYTGSAGTIPGTSSTGPSSNSDWITSTTGKISVVGNTRSLTVAGEWGVGVANVSSPNGFDLEINLNSGQTATVNTFFKCRAFNVVTGTLSMAIDARLSPAQSSKPGSNFVIQNGAIVISAATGTTNSAVFGYDDNSLSDTLWVKTGGRLVLTGATPKIGMTTIIFDGTVEYSLAGNQNLADKTNSGTTPNVYSNLTISGSGIKTIVNSSFTVNGTFSIQGSATLDNNGATFTYGASSILEYASTTANQTMTNNEFANTGAPRVPANLVINNAFGNVTLNANRTNFAGNITVSAGTFNLSTFTINRSSAGGSLTISNGATLKIGGTNTLPSNYSTHSIGQSSTIEYSGTGQNIASLNSSQNFGNLIISGSGIKTATGAIQTHTDGDITISSTLADGGFDILCGGNVLGSGTITGAGNLEMLVHAKSISAVNISNLKINTGGNINLSAGLNITGSLNFALGTLSLGTSNLILNSAATITGNSNTKFIITNSTGVLTRNSVGASNTIFPVGTTSSYNPVTLNNAGTSDNFSVRVKTTFDNAPNIPAQVVNRAWDITESVGGGSDVTITLQWNANEEAGSFDRSSGLHISHYSGSWVNTSASLAGADPYTATASNFTSFSEFGVGSDGALPVELASFTSSLSGNAVNLNWQTATEVNNYGFEVQRSVVSGQRSEWERVGFVEGNGNSNSPKEYSFEDESVKNGKYSYRLKQIDIDGKFEYSDEIEVDIKTTPLEFNLAQNYPNPFNPSTVISYQLSAFSNVKLTVYDVLGNEVIVLVNKEQEAGVYQFEWVGSGLSSGVYYYKINAVSLNGEQNFTSVKKMLLLK